MQQLWPGNVHELENTRLCAAVWSEGAAIDAVDLADAMLPRPAPGGESVLGRAAELDVGLPELIAEVTRHYLS